MSQNNGPHKPSAIIGTAIVGAIVGSATQLAASENVFSAFVQAIALCGLLIILFAYLSPSGFQKVIEATPCNKTD